MNKNIHQIIHDLPKIDRPQEKLIHYGSENYPIQNYWRFCCTREKKEENVVDMLRKILR